MMEEHDKEIIRQLARQFNVKRVLLFGSSSDEGHVGRDYDIAVSGIPASSFFRFYGDLMWRLSKPVDLVDLDRDSLFTRMIRKEGISVYEQFAG